MINFVESTQAGARQATPDDLDQAFADTLQLAGGTMTGPLLLAADPTAPAGAATMRYVDGQIAAHAVAPADLAPISTAIADETTARQAAINAAIVALALSNAVFYSDPARIDPTGIKDSAAGLQDPITRAAAAGGGAVIWPAGKFRIDSPIVNNASGVRIIGAGRGAFHDTAPYVQAATTLIWYGPVGGTMLSVGAVQASTAQKLTNADVLGIALEGTPDLVTRGADYGLVITSVQHSNFDVQTAEFGVAAVAFTTGVALNEAANNEGNTMSLRFRQINLPGTALQLGGSAMANTCFCEFPIVFGYIKNGIGIDFQDCDSNRVHRAWIDRVQGGTGTNVYFRSDAQFGGNGRCSRVNTIFDLSQSVHSGSIYAEGLEAAGAVTASYGNRVIRFDLANALPSVLNGTGASFFMSYNTSPIGLRDSNVKAYSGYMQHTNGVVDFWNATGLLGAGTISTFTMEFSCTRILEVSAQVLGVSDAPGQVSCYNYDTGTRADGAKDKFDLYAPISAYYSYRGRALAPL